MNCQKCAALLPNSATFCGKCRERVRQPLAAESVIRDKSFLSTGNRNYCGRCGLGLRADGACGNCVSAAVPGNPKPSTMPEVKIRWKPILITGGILLLGLSAAYAVNVWKGDTLLVRTNVPGAAVSINGTERGRTSAERFAPLSIGHLHGGTYEIVARADGFEDVRRQVTFPLRSQAPITLSLVPKPAGLQVQSAPGSLILLNGQIRGRADSSGSWVDRNLPPTSFFLTVRHEGRIEWTRNLVLKPGEILTLTADQPEVAPPPTPETAPGTPVPQAPIPPVTQAAPTNHVLAEQLFGRARQAFASRNYNAAQRLCAEGLQLIPGDRQGTALCQRIDEVRRLTNQQ